jgi:two-component system OmpR family response regulator
MRILVVEDDLKIADFMSKGLAANGYSVTIATDGEYGYELASTGTFDAVILDLMLPKLSGLEVLKKLRQQKSASKIMVLSAKRSVDERVLGLQAGADDYMTKPFAYSELLARIQALLRRGGAVPEKTNFDFSDVHLDLLSREVHRAGKKVDLQPREFSLLEFFLRNPGVILSKNQILERIWSYNFDPQTKVVDVLVCRLRNKLDRGFEKKLIHTIRGVGYALKN